jgi:hypothetical protein
MKMQLVRVLFVQSEQIQGVGDPMAAVSLKSKKDRSALH